MTRKDYRQIADALVKSIPSAAAYSKENFELALTIWEGVLQSILTQLEKNSNFDRAKFVQYVYKTALNNI